MASRNVITPSALRGTVRNLKGKEANVLADQVKARKLTTFDHILESCFEALDDPGKLGDLYITRTSDDAPPKINWDRVLLGDRFAVLMQIRIATYGSEYNFKHKCESCGESFEWEVDLVKDLRMQSYSPETIEKYKNGNRFDAELPDGKLFHFKLLTGEDEKRAAKRAKQKKDEAVTVALSERILSIDGVGDDKVAIRSYLEDLDIEDIYEAIDTIDEQDGGYVTDINVDCEHCGAENLVRLPFGGDFWISRKNRRKRAAGED